MPALKTIIDTLKRGRGDRLVSAVDRVLLQRNQVATQVEGFLHPSSLVPWRKGWGHICPRELFYTRFANFQHWPATLLQDDFSPRTFRIFDNGQWVHRRWQIYLILAGMVHPEIGVGWEVPVQDVQLGLLGHIDAIAYPESAALNEVRIEYFDHGIPKFTSTGGLVFEIVSNGGKWIQKGKPVVVDVKSMKEEYWHTLHNQPMSEHAVQMTCYMALKNISEAHLLYENKNTQEVKEIAFPLDRFQWAKFREILLEVNQACHEERLPDRICHSALGNRARECAWVGICFSSMKFPQLVQIEHGHAKKTAQTGAKQ
jgi:hypothetical protein